VSQHLRVGQTGEDLAVEHLIGQGLRIIERNLRTVFGEIDVVCLDRETVVFVEVKTRTSTDFSDPLDAIDRRKMRRLSRAALHYLARRSWEDRRARFDVLSVSWLGDRPVIDYIADAFDLNGE
jgi:putative endonuclease